MTSPLFDGLSRDLVPESDYTPSFSAVLLAAQRGEDGAFEQIYRAMYRRVLAFVRVRGAPDPEATTHEAFLSAYSGLETFTGNEDQFNAWIFRITRNKLIDESRRRDRRPVEVYDASPPDAEQAPDDVEREALDSLATESLYERLALLTPDQRDVVLLRIVSDLTIESIAEVLDKSPGAIKSLQRRAFRAIARSL